MGSQPALSPTRSGCEGVSVRAAEPGASCVQVLCGEAGRGGGQRGARCRRPGSRSRCYIFTSVKHSGFLSLWELNCQGGDDTLCRRLCGHQMKWPMRKLPLSRVCALSPLLQGAPTGVGRAAMQSALLVHRTACGTVPAIL